MNIGELFRQAKDAQAKMQAMQDQLAALEIEGVAGAGLVRVTLSGKSDMKRVFIDPSLLKPESGEVVADLIVAAHADAKTKVERRAAEEMAKIARDMGLPPGMLPG
ncbi:MAG TPA: YbaB/EbfC family nucleoid-associated protein [Rhizomicrobium sp.]